MLQSLDHENIVKLNAVEEDDNYLFMFLEYLNERDIYTYMQRNGRLSEEVAFKYFAQMLSALEHCHQRNISHHDFKVTTKPSYLKQILSLKIL